MTEIQCAKDQIVNIMNATLLVYHHVLAQKNCIVVEITVQPFVGTTSTSVARGKFIEHCCLEVHCSVARFHLLKHLYFGMSPNTSENMIYARHFL